MDVLRPQLVRIGNRLYRKNQVASKDPGFNPEDEIEPGIYYQFVLSVLCVCSCVCVCMHVFVSMCTCVCVCVCVCVSAHTHV